MLDMIQTRASNGQNSRVRTHVLGLHGLDMKLPRRGSADFRWLARHLPITMKERR
ncbi:uncharacterized protein BKA78DRAFT_302235 [Phyllosticta capitalensis]|uniref:uncharacterized protein n=1 Tax=Phyllosticta capitalensis TaxID=121624 RepID=UPI00312CD03B